MNEGGERHVTLFSDVKACTSWREKYSNCARRQHDAIVMSDGLDVARISIPTSYILRDVTVIPSARR